MQKKKKLSTPILSIISTLVMLYGIYGPNFMKVPSLLENMIDLRGSFFNMMTSVVGLLDEGQFLSAFFTGESNADVNFYIWSIRVFLFLPFVILILLLINQVWSRFMAFVACLVEAGIFFYILDLILIPLSEHLTGADQPLRIFLERLAGIPGWALFAGLGLMVIFTFLAMLIGFTKGIFGRKSHAN